MKKRLLVILLFVFLSLVLQINVFGEKEKTEKEYLDGYLKKYPLYKKEIKYVFPYYTAWLIEGEEKYGILPFIAFYYTNENNRYVLYQNFRKFHDVYNIISKKYNSDKEEVKVKITLKFITLFNYTSKRSLKEYYKKGLKNAEDKDKRLKTNRYVKAFLRNNPAPVNYLEQVLRSDKKKLDIILNEVDKLSYSSFKFILNYPNALPFILNAGEVGFEVIKKYQIEPLFISLFLEEEKIKDFAEELNRSNEYLYYLIAYYGLDGYIIYHEFKEFFTLLADEIDADNEFKALLSYKIIKAKVGENNEKLNDLKTLLSKTDITTLAVKLGKISNTENTDGSKGYYSLVEDNSYVIDLFVNSLKKKEEVERIIKNYGNYKVAKLIIVYYKDLSEIAIEAVNRYGHMGIQALKHFRMDDRTINWIKKYRVKGLMVIHYNFGEDYNTIYERGKDYLDDYTLEKETGRPKHKKTGFGEFLPGYDIIKLLYNSVKYGYSPTLGELLWSGLDVADIAITLTTLGAGKTITSAIRTAKKVTKGIKKSKRMKLLSKFKKPRIKFKKVTKNTKLKEYIESGLKGIKLSSNVTGKRLKEKLLLLYKNGKNLESIKSVLRKNKKILQKLGLRSLKANSTSFSKRKVLPWLKNRLRPALKQELLAGTIGYTGIHNFEKFIEYKRKTQKRR